MYGHNFPAMTRHDIMIDIGEGYINLKENYGSDFQCQGEDVICPFLSSTFVILRALSTTLRYIHAVI